ncbi:uncharacterized protein VICG_00354 [Vittaforma corneae ATCC 50505]|uniref:Uncharacterized protein n=1 Tax=Vittaforma corneae (strain ATCC 50505) TaxID=993615 RepID=L2GQL7_VITCO|nr:uncharacterized protein VICG_00354 [Vittaforma corneae ATCC 50505]ELA42602.1 hypothetical protein VICG_00354 [Vittaforma corneae ATCC 50505]
MINAIRADAGRYHTVLAKNGISQDFELPFIVYDQYLSIVNSKLKKLFSIDINDLKTENLRGYLKNRVAPHISSCFHPDEPFELFAHFRHGHKAFSFFIEELRKKGVRFANEHESVTAFQALKQFFRLGGKSEIRDDGHSKELHSALNSFDTLLTFLKEEKSTETDEVLPFSEICSLFVMHLDYLNSIRAFAPNSSYPDILELIRNAYLSLLKLNYISHSVMKNWIDPTELHSLTDSKIQRFNFLKQEMHSVLKSFNINVMILINLIDVRFATMEIHFRHVFRTLSIIRSINSLFKICTDLMLLAVQKRSITRENARTFIDDMAFISSNITLYSLDDKFIKTGEFAELFDLPLSETNQSFFSGRAWPFARFFSRGDKQEEHVRDHLRSCTTILSPLESDIDAISSEYKNNEIDIKIKNIATKKKEKDLDVAVRQKFPEFFENPEARLDRMLELVLFVTEKNLSSCKSAIKDEKQLSVAVEQIKRAFKEASYSKFKLRERTDRLFELYNVAVSQNDPNFRKISFETTGFRPVLDIIFEKFNRSAQTEKEYQILSELAALEVQKKMAMIAIWILIMTDTVLIVFNRIKGRPSTRKINARRREPPRYNYYH